MNTTEDLFTKHVSISISGDEKSKKSVITVKFFEEKTILEISAFTKTPLEEVIKEIDNFSGYQSFIVEENRRQLAKIVLFPRLTLLCFKSLEPVFYPILFRIAFANKIKNLVYGFRTDNTVEDVKEWVSKKLGIQTNDFELINNWRLMKSNGILDAEMVIDNGHVECYLRGNLNKDSRVNVVTQDGMIYSFDNTSISEINSELSKIMNRELESFKITLRGKLCVNFEDLDRELLFVQLTNKSFALNFKYSSDVYSIKFDPDDLIEYVRQTIKFIILIPYN